MRIIEEVKTFFGLSYKFYQNEQTILNRLWEFDKEDFDIIRNKSVILSVQ